MKVEKIYIKGMHCRSCEILIEDELKKVPGIKQVSVNHQAGAADIYYENEFEEKAVRNAIETAGYNIGQDGKAHIFSRNRKDYVDLGIAFLIAMNLFLIARILGIFNLGNSISGTYSSLPVVFLVGLTAGVSTCMALVGGLILGASARFAEKNPNATRLEKFKPHLFFNLGRIMSYFVLGGVIGLAGSLLQLSTSLLGTLTIAVGAVMLLLGGQLIDVFPVLKKVSFTLPKSLHRMFGIKDRSKVEYSNKNSVVMGALTFFLPCGFTQAMQLYAMSTGSIVLGALTMGVFALGTTPGLLGLGGLMSAVKGGATKLFFKTAGVIVIFLALFNVSNGLNLLGINPNVIGAFATNSSSASDSTQQANATLTKGTQEIRMTQGSYGYTPNKFTVKKGIPVRWIITSENANSCASSIVSQQLGIRRGLQLGENIIEFTPTETGTIRFSCIMGMYTGSFEVIDENNNSTTAVPSSPTIVGSQNTSSASCGGNGGGCGCGGAKKTVSAQNSTQPAGQTIIQGNIQVLKATYTSLKDITPNRFTVSSNQPVRFEIAAEDNGQGCMGSVMLPGLAKKVEVFTKGQTVVFEFTPTTPGSYNITCAMGVPRGQIQVN